MGTRENDSVDVRRWYRAEELEVCPDCGEQELVPVSSLASMRLCLSCGVAATTLPGGLPGPNAAGVAQLDLS
jgi:hypothetical protein